MDLDDGVIARTGELEGRRVTILIDIIQDDDNTSLITSGKRVKHLRGVMDIHLSIICDERKCGRVCWTLQRIYSPSVGEIGDSRTFQYYRTIYARAILFTIGEFSSKPQYAIWLCELSRREIERYQRASPSRLRRWIRIHTAASIGGL